ncbi:hypothetical protein PT974_03533 [Cladobotryum mycophilum]|uniref:Uncharacterized protein n=1 Tax=Cladobotryum mycophilum TaxID=491253 RepID=A0ABR0SSK2_9HYPO
MDPRRHNNDHYGATADEDLDAVLLVPEPVSQEIEETSFSDIRPKKFFSSKDKISEATLSQGFSFPPREPPRPGQFPKRPVNDPRQRPPKSPSLIHSHHTSNASPSNPFIDLTEPCLPSQRPAKDQVSESKRQKQQGSKPRQLSSHHSSDDQRSNRGTKQRGSDSGLWSQPKHMNRSQVPDPIEMPQHDSPKGDAVQVIREAASSPGKISCSTSGRRSNASKHAEDVLRNLLESQDLERTLPHIRRLGRKDSRHSPASQYGDLEVHTRRSPARLRRHSRDALVNRPTVGYTPLEGERLPRLRSQSRASTIPKKKASAHKHRSRPDPDRKMIAMNQVAEHWNECVRITEDETIQANLEIERLQEDLHFQGQQLQESRVTLDHINEELHNVESLYKKLQDDDSRVIGENKTLSNEIESLRNELSESKSRSETLADKYRTYKSRLSEAIREQKDLFISCRNQYQEMIGQLRKESERKIVDSEAVDKALDESRKKREEMKKCIGELRVQTQREIQQKDRTISELKGKIRDNEAKMLQENNLCEQLRLQVADQMRINKTVKDLETKIDSLLDMSFKANGEQQKGHDENVLIINRLHEKLDSTIADWKLSVRNIPTLKDIEPKMRKLEDKVVARILPAVMSVINGQNNISNAASQFVTLAKSNFNTIQGEMNQQTEENRMQWEESHRNTHEFMGMLRLFGEDLYKTQQLCQQIEPCLDS